MATLKGRRVTVAGLGISGRALVDWLLKRGALVGVSESKPETEFAEWLKAKRTRLERTEFGGHTEAFLLSSDLVVVSPGIPPMVPALGEARRRGVPVVGDLEVVLEDCRAKVVAVTGTNGKTTTTALLGHLLKVAGLKAVVAGNIGIPLAEVADGAGPGDILVIEVSSFQLDITPSLHPFAALLLNITPDHLDRYRDYGTYVRSKESVFRNQDARDLAVLNRQDPRCAALAPALKARVRWFDSKTADIEGAGLDGEWMAVNEGGMVTRVLRRADFPLRGAHNLENGLAAVSAAWSLGVRERPLAEGLRSFGGVEHRMEPAGIVGGVEFVNDSKATNTDSQEKALMSFTSPVVLIAGGRDKGLDFTTLRALVGKAVKAGVLIGEAADKIGAAWDGVTRLERAGTMEQAVEAAYLLARPRGVVLLSPGCASYDMFANFEERGRAFKDAVRRLATRIGEGVAP